MQYEYWPSYFRLYPPSSFLRETNKLATCFSIYLIILGFFWSYDISLLHLHRVEITDLLLAGSILLILWYAVLSIISFKRLNRYRGEYKLSRMVHHLLIPWAALVIVTSTIMIFALIDRTTDLSPTGNIFYKQLYKILISELAVLAAFEVPGLKKWLPEISPLRFKRIFMKSLPVLIGRERRADTEEHARQVFEFKSEFENYLRDIDSIARSDPKEIIDAVEMISGLDETEAAKGGESLGD
jgi:hypothetical protein